MRKFFCFFTKYSYLIKKSSYNNIYILQPLGIVTKYYIYRCKSPGRDIAVYILYGIKALLQVIALIFAFSIRKVNVKGLNDSQYVIASVYLGSVFLTIVIVCVVTLGHYVNYLIVVTCTIYSFGATATLLLIFIPKVSIRNITF